ncbi:MAG: hypothetical protein COT91_00090 [Candidatus Doudnabacteria bacterium CG10_big_fil_rev_8_21_14_0_10_41_10]|uniref:DUF11 domain-containing protein n=1 Tax=Candidatus Doudnabacteria bacterium CG10_big_fil_rev_8_21_14_0_10_41_10 TaxID=1974551 RepID=A0A2H0VHB4_9BACT|nr:MAG: hypothetical protein COT91_00090 [Candidatus Doudnabacteria bacterium CG10_big_fil_rev_8_21_14_0_10_41_10]
MRQGPQINEYSVTPVLGDQLESGATVKRFFFNKYWVFSLVAIVVVAVALWFLLGGNGKDEAKLVLWFDIADQITSGSQSEVTLIYENQGKLALEELELEVIYPEGFQFIDSSHSHEDYSGQRFLLPSLSPGSSGTLTITGIFSASPQESKTIRARLFYQLPRSTAVFSESAEAQLSFKAPNFNLRVLAPNQLIDSQGIEYQIFFKNISDKKLQNLEVRLSFPNGFIYDSSSIPTETKNTWLIEDLEVGQEERLIVRGTLSGEEAENKVLRADLGIVEQENFEVLARASASTRISAAPLEVKQNLKSENPKSVSMGERLSYKISYKNTGSRGLNNIKISVFFEGEGVDFSSVQTSGGALVGNEVLWNPSGRSELTILQPGEEGFVDLNIQVPKSLAEKNLQNPMIKTRIFISSNEFPEPIAGGTLDVKVASKMNVDAGMRIVDGANPPKKEEATIYEVSFDVSSGFNELSNVIWTAVLTSPPGEFDFDSISQELVKDINYNPASGRIVWKIGNLSFFEKKQIKFNVKFFPSVADSNKTIKLVKDIKITAKDEFTEETITSESVNDLITVPVN